MRRSLVVAVGCALLVAACSDRATDAGPTGPSAARQAPATTAVGCISADSVESLIRAVFPAGNTRSSALSRWNQVVRRGGTVQALQLVDFLLNKYFDGQLIGGTSAATANTLSTLLNGVLCFVGLPPLDPSVLGLDGAAAVIYPNSPTTTIVTGTQFSGVTVPGGSVTEPTLITISRLPDSPWPLATPLDQYPLFYEFHAVPSTTPFTTDVLIGVCTAGSVIPPDPSRLRIAHNLAAGGIEITELATASFLDCTNADVALAPAPRWLELARGGWNVLRSAAASLAPQPLYAMKGGTGLGGTVRTFSPFGAVDTLGIMTAASTLEQHGWINQLAPYPPAVTLTTPTGRAMADVAVTFAVTAGGGTLAGANVLTDAAGGAAVTAWTFGTTELNRVSASAAATPGSGYAGAPVVFTGLAHTPR